MNTQTKYYAIRNKFLANGVAYITGQRYFIVDDKVNPNVKLYTFERTDALFTALQTMNQLKKSNELN